MADGLEKLLGKTGIDVVTRLLGIVGRTLRAICAGRVLCLPSRKRRRGGEQGLEQLVYYASFWPHSWAVCF